MLSHAQLDQWEHMPNENLIPWLSLQVKETMTWEGQKRDYPKWPLSKLSERLTDLSCELKKKS